MLSTKEIVARLKAIREGEGLSLEKFAREISSAGYEISTSTLGSIESGRTKSVDVRLILAIVEITGTPVWEIVGGPLPTIRDAPAFEFELTGTIVDEQGKASAVKVPFRASPAAAEPLKKVLADAYKIQNPEIECLGPAKRPRRGKRVGSGT